VESGWERRWRESERVRERERERRKKNEKGNKKGRKAIFTGRNITFRKDLRVRCGLGDTGLETFHLTLYCH